MSSASMVKDFLHGESSSITPSMINEEAAQESWDELSAQLDEVHKFPELSDAYCQILLSRPADWSSKMIALCNGLKVDKNDEEQVKKDESKEIAIMHIFLHIGKNYPLNLKAHQAILSSLGKIAAGASLDCPQEWYLVSQSATQFYSRKLVDHIRNLEKDIDIIQFSSMQRELGAYGISLVRDWPPQVQKKIFLVWVLSIQLYAECNSERKSFLELQVAYISLIHKTSDLSKHKIGSEYLYQQWLDKRVDEYKNELVSHISSLNRQEFHKFICHFQDDIKPSGFQINSFSSSSESYPELKSQCIFWTRYMNLYIEIRHMEILKPFGILIEDLAAENLKEISNKLDSFLEAVYQPNIQDLLVIQFMNHLSNDTNLDLKSKCKTAFAEFEHLKQEATNDN